MAMQGFNPQSFDGSDLIIGYFHSLCFQLKKPSIQIGQRFFLVLSYWQEYKHLSGSLKHQFVVEPSREIMSYLARVASCPPAEAMAASLHIRNL
jgi:hypothetical protein